MSQDHFALVLSLLMIPFTIGVLYWFLVLPDKRLNQWAQKRGLKLITSDDVTNSDNPYSIARGQIVFRIKVLNPDGMERTGYLKCGSVYGGLLSDYCEEFWDDKKPL
ncbi:MAG: hypothetical protein WCT04_11935 [Planctomycetota bacterium]